jgi:PAS domain S-box-containing protein
MAGKKPAIQGQEISKEIFRSVFDDAPIGNCLVSLDGRFLRVNRAFCHMLGYSESELLSMTFGEVTHPDDLSASNEWVRNLLSGKSTDIDLEKRYLHKTGNVVWGIVRSFLLRDAGGQPLFFSTSIQDITDHKQAEKTLQESEEKYRELFENAIDPIFILDAEHNFVDMNNRAIDLFGYSREEFLHMKVFDIIPPEQVPSSREEFEKLRTQGKYEKFIGKICTKDGRWLDIEVSSSAIFSDGKIVGSRDIVRDITERKKAEEILRERGEILERIFNSTHFSIVYLDKNFNFIRVNKAYADACGYPPEFFSGKNHFDLYPHEENEAIFRHVAETGTQFTIYAKPFEYPDHPEWGMSYWDWTLYPVKSVDGTVEGLILILLDVTRNKKAEDALRENEIRFRAVFENSVDAIGVSKNGVHER